MCIIQQCFRSLHQIFPCLSLPFWCHYSTLNAVNSVHGAEMRYIFFNRLPLALYSSHHTHKQLCTPIRVKKFTPCNKFCSGPKSSVGNPSVWKRRCVFVFFVLFCFFQFCLLTLIHRVCSHFHTVCTRPVFPFFFSNSTVPTTGQQDTSIYKG